MERQYLLQKIQNRISSLLLLPLPKGRHETSSHVSSSSSTASEFIRHYILPVSSAALSGCNFGSKQKQLRSDIINLFKAEIVKLRNHHHREPLQQDPSVETLCDSLLDIDHITSSSPSFLNILKAIDFVSSICIHLEQEQDYKYRGATLINHKEKKDIDVNSSSSSSLLSVENECRLVFLLHYFNLAGQEGKNNNATTIKKIINYASSQIVKMFFELLMMASTSSSNNNSNNNAQVAKSPSQYLLRDNTSTDSIHQSLLLVKAAFISNNVNENIIVLRKATFLRCLVVDCFGMFSGFRKTLVSKLRRVFHIRHQVPLGEKGAELANIVFDKIEKTKALAAFILPENDNNNRQKEFMLSSADRCDEKNSTSCFKPVSYGSSATILIKTIKKVCFLGACDSVSVSDEATIQKSIVDFMLRDKDSGIDKSILLKRRDDSDSCFCSSAWKMVQIAGEEAVGAILQRRIQTHLAMKLEQLRSARNDENNSDESSKDIHSIHSSIIEDCLLPWYRFVLCDDCCEKNELTNESNRGENLLLDDNNDTSSSSSLVRRRECPSRKCCANHTLVAGGVKEAVRAVFSMPRFETFSTFCILNEFDQMMRSNNNNKNKIEVQLYRTIQALTMLPSHYSNNTSSNSNKSFSSSKKQSATTNHQIEEGDKKSWPLYFHHLAYQRMIDQNNNQGNNLNLELFAASLLQDLCDAETQFYPRQYKGMIRGILAGNKLLIDDGGKQQQNNILLIPEHFAPVNPFDLLPGNNSNNAVHSSASSKAPLFSFSSSSATCQQQLIPRQIRNFQQLVLQQAPSTKLSWVLSSSSSSCIASIYKNKFRVSGSLLQIAVLYAIGGSDNQTITMKDLSSSVIVSVDALEMKIAIDSLKKSGLISTVAEDNNNQGVSLTLVPDNSNHSDSSPNEMSLSLSSCSSSNRRQLISTFFNQKITKIAQEINARKAQATASSRNNNNNTADDMTDLADRTRSKSADRGSSSSSTTSLISPIVIRAQALRLIKRAGKLQKQHWMEATRQLVKYNVAKNIFDEVVDKLVEGEFCNRVANSADDEDLNSENEEYEYLV